MDQPTGHGKTDPPQEAAADAAHQIPMHPLYAGLLPGQPIIDDGRELPQEMFNPETAHAIFQQMADREEEERSRAAALARGEEPHRHVRRGPRTPPYEPGMEPVMPRGPRTPPYEPGMEPMVARPRGPRTPPYEPGMEEYVPPGPRTPPYEPGMEPIVPRGPRTPPYEPGMEPVVPRGPRTPPYEPGMEPVVPRGPRTPPYEPGMEPIVPRGPRTPPYEPGMEPIVPRGPRTPPYEPGMEPVVPRGPRTPPYEPGMEPVVPRGPRTPPYEPGMEPVVRRGPRTPPIEPVVHRGPRTPPMEPVAASGPRTPPLEVEPPTVPRGPRTPPYEPGMEPVRPRGPRTPPLEPGMELLPGEPGYVAPEDVPSDGEIPAERGPKTPPQESQAPPEPTKVQQKTVEKEHSGKKRSHETSSHKKRSKKRGPRTPPSRSRPSSRTPSPNSRSRNGSSSPVTRRQSRKRRANDKNDGVHDGARELLFPPIASQKTLSLLEFVERRGLTITDDELLQVVQDSIVLDQAMGAIIKKREKMKKELDEMADKELERIKKIHGNLPRHMQDVLKFDGKTVHISQERTAMPPMPFSTPSVMSLKYGPLAHQMGMPPPGMMPPGAPPPFATSMGMPPPPMGIPPSSNMGMGPPPFAVPPPIGLLGPPPFSGPPLMPPPPASGASGPQTPQRPTESESRNAPQGLNPIAFSNAPPGLKLAPMPEYSRPPPAKKAATQNPQMTRITNNLSNMLTNALKAQVSKAPFSSEAAPSSSTGTTTPKKAVPSLMSINIPGVPKPTGPSGASQN